MNNKTVTLILMIILIGLLVKYWWVVLIVVSIAVLVRSVKNYADERDRKRRALIARAEAGYHNHLNGGTGLFDENLEMYYPVWVDREYT